MFKKGYTVEFHIHAKRFHVSGIMGRSPPPITSSAVASVVISFRETKPAVHGHAATVCRVGRPRVQLYGLGSEPLCHMDHKGWEAWAGSEVPSP